ncbi:hypothetical protein [Lelliottia amnigena]|uniref:hypothetical protein n=1 Tax=Lelliottia amnigena TaxID=61646 RepID=UPI001C5CBC51|nr:hypothetical protein [Lelliottia amnigena]QXZ20582.1 hypothetical protein I6L75_05370 [Lelliottia amnigena]
MRAKKITYSVNHTGATYPAVKVTESSISVSAKMLGGSITKEKLEQYGVWNEK